MLPFLHMSASVCVVSSFPVDTLAPTFATPAPVHPAPTSLHMSYGAAVAQRCSFRHSLAARWPLPATTPANLHGLVGTPVTTSATTVTAPLAVR